MPPEVMRNARKYLARIDAPRGPSGAASEADSFTTAAAPVAQMADLQAAAVAGGPVAPVALRSGSSAALGFDAAVEASCPS